MSSNLIIVSTVGNLFLLAVPIACISWTVTHEEVFKEPRDWCLKKCKTARSVVSRKFFYLFTCEYCFSHYITVLFLFLTNFKLLADDWRGYIIAGFSLVWIANVYMSLYGFIRVGLKKERITAAREETVLKKEKREEPQLESIL